ncbi:hypothetical protein C8R43DRAFT_960033 [Mycena crocata]|nr:hypothetical protein C8R43DRAFT_960033 [Mycena crocata]
MSGMKIGTKTRKRGKGNIEINKTLTTTQNSRTVRSGIPAAPDEELFQLWEDRVNDSNDGMRNGATGSIPAAKTPKPPRTRSRRTGELPNVDAKSGPSHVDYAQYLQIWKIAGKNRRWSSKHAVGAKIILASAVGQEKGGYIGSVGVAKELFRVDRMINGVHRIEENGNVHGTTSRVLQALGYVVRQGNTVYGKLGPIQGMATDDGVPFRKRVADVLFGLVVREKNSSRRTRRRHRISAATFPREAVAQPDELRSPCEPSPASEEAYLSEINTHGKRDEGNWKSRPTHRKKIGGRRRRDDAERYGRKTPNKATLRLRDIGRDGRANCQETERGSYLQIGASARRDAWVTGRHAPQVILYRKLRSPSKAHSRSFGLSVATERNYSAAERKRKLEDLPKGAIEIYAPKAFQTRHCPRSHTRRSYETGKERERVDQTSAKVATRSSRKQIDKPEWMHKLRRSTYDEKKNLGRQ